MIEKLLAVALTELWQSVKSLPTINRHKITFYPGDFCYALEVILEAVYDAMDGRYSD